MSTNTKEIGFEAFIEQWLTERNGYVRRLSSQYDKDLCLDSETLLSFVSATQGKEWEKLVEQFGEDRAKARFLDRVTSEIRERGVLDVLRNGVRDSGSSFSLAFFKPVAGLNPETLALYGSNVFSEIRQLKYSKKNENSIDMVLFLNGIPVMTVELKNQFTGQSVEH